MGNANRSARRRSWPRRGWIVLGAVLASTFPRASADEPDAHDDVGAGATAPPRYAGLVEIGRRLAEVASTTELEAELLDFGPTLEGRSVPAVLFGRPGSAPVSERPTLWLLGGLDGRSLAGCEAVLVAVEHLLEVDGLRSDVAILAVPWGAPDVLARARGGEPYPGRPGDEDGDGLLDEDGPDDADGDGRVLEMLVEDSRGRWTWGANPGVAVLAQPGDQPRLTRTVEGVDDDADGLYNEDGPGPGGIDGAFPIGWRGPGLPMEDPLARRLADELLRRPSVAVVAFQGAHGSILLPGVGDLTHGRAVRDEDARALEGIAEALSWPSARPVSRSVRTASAGSFLDWCYTVAGVPAFEVAPWGPSIGRDSAPDELSAASEDDWMRWVDDRRGGLGYVPWRAIDVDGPRAWIGGWEPFTRWTPPEDELPAAMQGIGPCAEAAVAALPRLELVVHTASRDGDLVRLVARVVNRGAMPTELAATARWRGRGESGVDLELRLPVGARLFAGEAAENLPPLGGGETSANREWLVVAPAGSPFTLVASSPWCATVEREVRP